MSEVAARRPLVSAKDAREQAADELGFMAGVFIDLGDGKPFEIPNPSLLDPDQQDRYDQLQMDLEKLDRHPDPIDAEGNPLLDANGRPRRGDPLMPHRVDGVRQEHYETRLAKALFGDQYERFVNGGGRPSQVIVHWGVMNQQRKERESSDPKSVGGDQPVGDVPDADRVESP